MGISGISGLTDTTGVNISYGPTSTWPDRPHVIWVSQETAERIDRAQQERMKRKKPPLMHLVAATTNRNRTR